jgi:dTDP-4-amino-4,6-dideoxygalactose transaminase
MGKLGCLSFFPSKNLGGFGDGGMVVTNDEKLMQKIRILRLQGSKPKYYNSMIGGNFRLDTLQAAIVNVKLKYLDGWTKSRQENAKCYVELFQKKGLLEMESIALSEALYFGTGVSHYHIYNQFIIRVKNRDGLREYLKDEGIGSEVYYPVPFHLQECFKDLEYQKGDFPEAERAANETLGLPIYPELNQDQQQYVLETIKNFYQ